MVENKIKVVAMSDIHGYLPKDVPECDIVCIAGDILPLDIQRDDIKSVSWLLLDFKPWADALPCDKVIFVAGNHDFVFEHLGPYIGASAKDIMETLFGKHETKLVYLQDSSFYYKDKRFYGSPWCADLTNWAFYKSNTELQKAWNNIPKSCDVLITHMPPRYMSCGTVMQPGFNYMRDFGSNELTEVILARDIKYHVFGHVHSGSHCVTETPLGTKLINVSLKDENYKVTYFFTEFEV